jgi:hypothetical protein
MPNYDTWQKKLSDHFIISVILAVLSFVVLLISVNWH